MNRNFMMLRRGLAGWCALLATLALVACGGGAAVGDDCEVAGATEDECEDGAICGDDGSGALKCLVLCDDQAQCQSGEDCNGVTGSNLKGCRTAK